MSRKNNIKNIISALIIVKNEAKKIKKCLESVLWTDEIIVVDGQSADETVKIIKETAGTEKCKIYTRSFDNYKNQKNFGLKYCTKEWILAIDADERILPELKEEIQAELENPNYDFFAFPFLTYFLKKPLKYGLIYPAYHTRLFRKAGCRWVRTVHEQLKCNQQEISADSEKVKKMKNNVLHYSFDSVEHYFKKFNYYTSLDAVEMLKNKKDRFNRPVKFQPNNLWSCVWFFLYQPFRFFVRRFFRYKGYKDGVYGFIYAVFSAFYEAVVRVKYWHKIQGHKIQGYKQISNHKFK